MHPPFFAPDLAIGPAPDPFAKPPRRHAPARLDLRPSAGPGDFALLARNLPDAPAEPAERPKQAPQLVRPGLRLGPPPARGPKAWLGRWLIRTGQNLILPAAAGN